MTDEKILLSEFTNADAEDENIKEANFELEFINDEANISDVDIQSKFNADSQLNLESSAEETGDSVAQSINFGFSTGYAENSTPTLPNLDLSGPKFEESVMQKIEFAKNSGWDSKFKNFTSKKKVRILGISVIVALIGISYFTANKTEDAGLLSSSVQEENLSLSANTITLPQVEVAPLTETGTLNITGEQLVETASPGEGVTHLARRAIDKYLTTSGQTLTAEQKIYAEDYLKIAEGSYALSVGQEIGFEKSNVETAVNQALALESWQINNLKQYVN